jgi:hypothetical protein
LFYGCQSVGGFTDDVTLNPLLQSHSDKMAKAFKVINDKYAERCQIVPPRSVEPFYSRKSLQSTGTSPSEATISSRFFYRKPATLSSESRVHLIGSSEEPDLPSDVTLSVLHRNSKKKSYCPERQIGTQSTSRKLRGWYRGFV